MTIKTLSALALLATLPLAGAYADDYQYGYEKSSNTSTDDSGNVSKTTVEQSWATKDKTAMPVTDVNAPADAQPGVTTSTEATTETTNVDAAGQHSQSWYQSHLQKNGRYALDPETNKLEPVADNPDIHKLNHAAHAKSDSTDDNNQ